MPVLLLAAAVGCRNWLFADTSRGAKASATIYSLIETAKVNELEPYDYLHPVLKHIAAPTPLRGSKRCCRGTCRVNKRKKAESLALTTIRCWVTMRVLFGDKLMVCSNAHLTQPSMGNYSAAGWRLAPLEVYRLRLSCLVVVCDDFVQFGGEFGRLEFWYIGVCTYASPQLLIGFGGER